MKYKYKFKNGAEIERRYGEQEWQWITQSNPQWDIEDEYRVRELQLGD